MPCQNLHLTLAFLGSVSGEWVGRVEAAGNAVAGDFRPTRAQIVFTLDRVEYWRKARVLCATGSISVASRLAEALKSHLITDGFAPDPKPFRPHVTLVRNAARGPGQRQIDRVDWSFGGFALVDSKTGPQGSVYTVLNTFNIAGGP